MQEFNIAPIDSAFRSLCKILFGRDVGGLLKFEPYLEEAMMPYTIAKSSISGKEVFLSNPFYPKGAQFCGSGEVVNLHSPKISINDIKDIDSLFRAASENMVYAGNKMFGRSHNIGFVDNAISCIDVYYAHNVRNVKKGAYISYVRESEYVFGIPAFPKINYSMRCLEGINVNRMFETYYTNYSSDMYYSFNCYSCSECLFCFNLRGKRNMIGNLQLSPAVYSELKKKLTAEMADELEKNKRVFSISDLARMQLSDKEQEGTVQYVPTLPAPASVEKAWATASKIVLGQERNGITSYAGWLQQNTTPVSKRKGKFGKAAYLPHLPLIKEIPAAVLCTRGEAMEQNQPLVSEAEAKIGLKRLAGLISKKCAITAEMEEGACRDVPEVAQAIDSTECWAMWDATTSTRSALGTTAIESSYIFGGYCRMLNSEFCIDCYDVTKTKRALECDGLSDCQDCYFCHNMEGCEECILCCNVKGMRYAVLNQQLPKEEYARIKKMLLAHINAELDLEKKVSRSIFRLG